MRTKNNKLKMYKLTNTKNNKIKIVFARNMLNIVLNDKYKNYNEIERL